VRAVQLGEVVTEGDFAAEIPGSGSGAGSEDAEKSSCAVVAGSSVHLAIRDGKSGRLTVTGVFFVIPAKAGIIVGAKGLHPHLGDRRSPLHSGSSPNAVDLRDFRLHAPSPRRRPGSREG
jgi:hypothetical protein